MRNFKDLEVWSEGHKMTLSIYNLTRRFPEEERFGLTSQMRRSASVHYQTLEENLVSLKKRLNAFIQYLKKENSNTQTPKSLIS